MTFKKFKPSLLLIVSFGLAAAGAPSWAQAQAYTWNNVSILGGGFVSGIEASPAQSGLIYCRTDVGGAYRWNDASKSWIPLTDMFPMSQGNYLGIESLAPDPSDANIVYVAAGMYESNGNGVILSSTNQGSSWTVNTIGVPMGGNENGRGMGERLAVDPNLDSVLYFGSRTAGLWKSTTSGTSWSQVGGFPTDGPQNVSNCYGGTTNYGLPVVVIDGQGGSTGNASVTLFVAVAGTAAGSNLYESTNGGTSWALVTGGPTGLMVHHASLGSDGNLWLAYSNDYGPYDITCATLTGQVWKYKVSSGAWTNVTPSTNWAGMAGGISVDAQNPQHAIVSTLDAYAPDKVLATTNGGTSWTVIANPDAGYGAPYSQYNVNGAEYLYGFNDTYDAGAGVSEIGTNATNWVEAVLLDPFNSNRAFYGTGEGLFVSENIQAAGAPQAVTWTFEDKGQEETVPLYVPASTQGAFLGEVGDDGGMRNASLTTPASLGMYLNPRFSNTNSLDFAESNVNRVARVGNSGTTTSDVAYSTDNGQTWAPWGSAPPGYSTDNEMGSVAVAANGSTVVAAPYNGYGSPAYAAWGGGAWSTCSGLPSGAVVASDRVTPGLFYATSGNTLYVSTNGGQSFSTAGTTAGGAPRPVFGEAGEVWTANGGALYRFTGVGSTNTRTQITSVTTCYGVGFGKAAPSESQPAVFIIGTVSGQYGFFRCDDGIGTTWVRMNDDNHQYGWLQNNFIGGDEAVFGRCYLTTGGRGYIYGDTSAVTPTPTATSTATTTRTPTVTPTPTASSTKTPTVTATATPSATETSSPTQTVTMTSTPSATETSTVTPSETPSSTPSPTKTASPTVSMTPTDTPSITGTPTSTLSPTITSTLVPGATNTFTFTVTATPTASPTATETFTDSSTPSFSPTASASPTSTMTPPPGATNTFTPTTTATLTSTQTPLFTPTITSTSTPSETGTYTSTSTRTFTPTATPSWTATASLTPTKTVTLTFTPTLTPTSSWTPIATFTWTPTPTASWTVTPTPQATVGLSLSVSPSSVAPGAPMTYVLHLTVLNGNSNNTTLTLNLPSDVSFDGYTTGTSGTNSGNQVTWNLGTLAPGSYDYGVEVTVSTTATGSLSSQGSFSEDGGTGSSNTATVTVNPWTATPTQTSAPEVQPVIYPNPATGNGPVAIRLPAYAGMANVELKVFTTAFRMVNSLTYANQAGGSDVALPLTDRAEIPLADGLYYLLVQTPSGKSVLKLLILR